jgi:hypothetical protein
MAAASPPGAGERLRFERPYSLSYVTAPERIGRRIAWTRKYRWADDVRKGKRMVAG